MVDYMRRDIVGGIVVSMIPGISAAESTSLFQSPCACPRIEGPMQAGDYHMSPKHESPLVQFNRATRVIEVAVKRLEGNGIGKISILESGQ